MALAGTCAGAFAVLKARSPEAATRETITAASALAAPGTGSSGSPTASETARAAEPSLAAEVKLTIQATPAVVEVYLGSEKIGVSPGPISVKRGEEKVALTFKASGYEPKTLEIAPQADGLVSITLVRVPGTKPIPGDGKKKPRNGEYENPF